MGAIWGKSCKKCGETATKGDYCQRCYDQEFPLCDHCKKPMSTCEDKVGNCHKKPCYSDKSNKCCECNDTATKGSYCQSCYERKYPPTPLLEAQETAGGLSLKLNVGAASNQEFMKAAFQSFERALAGGAQQTKAITCGEKHSISDELEDEYYDKFTVIHFRSDMVDLVMRLFV